MEEERQSQASLVFVVVDGALAVCGFESEDEDEAVETQRDPYSNSVTNTKAVPQFSCHSPFNSVINHNQVIGHIPIAVQWAILLLHLGAQEGLVLMHPYYTSSSRPSTTS